MGAGQRYCTENGGKGSFASSHRLSHTRCQDDYKTSDYNEQSTGYSTCHSAFSCYAYENRYSKHRQSNCNSPPPIVIKPISYSVCHTFHYTSRYTIFHGSPSAFHYIFQ